MTIKVRRSYQKPRIKEVKLVPQEAVLATCKVNSGDAGPTSTCRNTGCRNAGAAS